MIRSLLIVIACMTAAPFIWWHFHKPGADKKATLAATFSKKEHKENTERLRLQSFGARLEQYADENSYNTRYCFLIDMNIASGSNRFFVYDMKSDSVLQSGLVAHGYGNSSGSNVTFSNTPGSNSSSQGKYKIAYAYYGKFGLAYKLYGLDKTNSNAFNRFVVLHAHECVPDSEVVPGYICMSQGCPTVAPSFLKKLAAYIDNSEKPVLLWIFK